MQKKPHPSIATLSLKAKGLYSMLEALQKDDELFRYGVISGEVLEHYTTNGETALRSALIELYDAGYISSKQVTASNGRFLGSGYYTLQNFESEETNE